MTVLTIPRQRAVARPAAPAPVGSPPTAWVRTLGLTLLAAIAGSLVQQALVESFGWASIVPGLVLAVLLACGGGR